MAAGKAVEKKQEAQVPALVTTPALEIDAGDIALPRIKIAQFSTEAAQEGLVKPGAIFATTGDDAEALVEPEAKEGVLIYVLGMTKGKSASVGGELVLFNFNDPNAPDDAWVTYNYSLCLPEVDPDVPYRWLFTRTGTPAAKQINTVLAKNAGKPPWENAFRVTTFKRENEKGKWFAPRVKVVEAKADHVETSANLAVMISGQTAEVQARGEEPAI